MKYQPITYSLLKSMGACYVGLELFKKHIGLERAIPLTNETIEKFSSIFDIDWAAEKLLDAKDYLKYDKSIGTAYTEFRKVHGPAALEYQKAIGPALTKYHEATDPANLISRKFRMQTFKEYEIARDIGWAEYNKVIDPAMSEYNKVRGAVFVRLYKLGMK